MNKLSVLERLRLSHVSRWHIVRVTHQQSVAEHTYRVWVIADHICKELELLPSIREYICHAALLHDLPEVILGDLPTPTKKLFNNSVVESIENSVDYEVAEAIASLKTTFPMGLKILKIADLAESVNYLDVEGMGNHAHEVCFLIRRQLTDTFEEARREFPDYRWERVSNVLSQICKGA